MSLFILQISHLGIHALKLAYIFGSIYLACTVDCDFFVVKIFLYVREKLKTEILLLNALVK